MSKPEQTAIAIFTSVKKDDRCHNDKNPRLLFFLEDNIWKPRTSHYWEAIEGRWGITPQEKDRVNLLPAEKRSNFDFWDILKFKETERLVQGFRIVMTSNRFKCEVDLHSQELKKVMDTNIGGYIVGHFFFDNQKKYKNTSLGIYELINLNV